MASILGLTGNIASGKTTVGLMLMELGAQIYVDADTVVHELYLPGQPLAAQIGQTFGASVMDADGGVNRRALGAIVFDNPERLRQLEALVHPAVLSALAHHIHEIPPDGVGVLDAVKLVESGYAPLCHALWIVTSPPEMQLRRLIETRDFTEAEARARLAAQPPIGNKRALATEIIDNSGSLADLQRQVSAAWRRFVASLP